MYRRPALCPLARPAVTPVAELLLSPKYKAFLRCTAPVEFLEGTTAAGKTTVALFKFMLRVAESDKRIHILSGLDLGTIEKNIISKELGILDDFGDLVRYWPSGRAAHTLPHLEFATTKGSKIIYVLGYGDKSRWKKALGGQYGCLYIDEINVADMDFVREAAMRCDYLLATLNPDDPGLPVYAEYINHARPLPAWAADTPREIISQLNQPQKAGWVHWFFSFENNLGLTPAKKAQIIASVPKGTKLYKNKIQGLRGRATGLVFDLQPHTLITAEKARQYSYQLFTAGLDTAYSQQSDDTFAMTFAGLTTDRCLVQLAARGYNNRDLPKPLSPSDIPPLLEQFLEACRGQWGFARDVFIDSADQATILECQKYKRAHGSIYNYLPAWKKTKIIDRINLQAGWMAQGGYQILAEACAPLVEELNLYSWKEDKYEPEDGHDHFINSSQYAWLPFKEQIG